jgi:DNA-binding GntR family transcriptional regulator
MRTASPPLAGGPVGSAQATSGADPGQAASVRVAAYLREAILDGRIRPGERILQQQIAEQVGASRLPVREALRILATEGLTEMEPNKGARVPRLDAAELDIVYRMRERLEPLALQLSLPSLGDEELARLHQIQSAIEENPDVAGFLQLDRQFHLLTYSGCIEPLAGNVLRLWNATQHYRRTYMTLIGPSRQWVINAEHNLLLDAIARADGVDAGRYLEGHIRRTRLELSRNPEIFARSAG